MLNSRISALEMMFFLALDWIVKLDLIAFEEFPQDETINVIIMIFNTLDRCIDSDIFWQFIYLYSVKKILKHRIFATGKSYTTSSCRILQGGNAAKVYGCSGVM